MDRAIGYRFCVQKKPAPDVPEVSRRIFITRDHMTEVVARERYEVIERLDHTAMELGGPRHSRRRHTDAFDPHSGL